MTPLVSVIVPARNAGATIEQALASLSTQRMVDWEAIVVENGSTDATAAIVERHAAADPRIRLLRSSADGVGAARNEGIADARGEFLLFLDADDTIDERHLALTTSVLRDDPSLTAVHCGWALVMPDGTVRATWNLKASGDLFDEFSARCVFAIHACLLRHSCLSAVGGFDTTLRACEDWDLWVRIARTGARFASIPDVLAIYHRRAGSASADVCRLFADGLRVLERSHGADPRVESPAPTHGEGAPWERVGHDAYALWCWCAGALMLEDEATALPEQLVGLPDPQLNAEAIAGLVLEGAAYNSVTEVDWPGVWGVFSSRLERFLAELELGLLQPGLAATVHAVIERTVLELGDWSRPFTLGRIYGVDVELCEPVGDVVVAAGASRAHVRVVLDGTLLGSLELPVFGDRVPASLLEDACAAEFAWSILGAFFERSIYPTIDVPRMSSPSRRVAISDATPSTPEYELSVHDRIGWTVFLQELWGRPDWIHEDFYAAGASVAASSLPMGSVEPTIVEVSAEARTVASDRQAIDLLALIGGAPAARVGVPVRHGSVQPDATCRAVTQAGGFEICRVAVREALIGRPLDDPATLRERLVAEASGRSWQVVQPDALAPIGLVDELLGAADVRLVVGRHRAGAGESAARRAVLPGACSADLAALAELTGAPIFGSNAHRNGAGVVVYAPEIVPLGMLDARVPATSFPARASLARRAIRLVPPRVRRARSRPTTAKLPILMYHRVSPDGAVANRRYRVTPDELAGQLEYLRARDFQSASLEEWTDAMQRRRALPGRRVLLTFDDGYRDLATHAWPILQAYGFSAVAFVVADQIGAQNDWERDGERVPLLDWDEIRQLEAQGLTIGSHSCRHDPLTMLTPTEVVSDLVRSRVGLERNLGRPITAFCYPFGMYDTVVRHLVGASGYSFGLACAHAMSSLDDSPLALSRLEVRGATSLAAFASMVVT